MTKDFDADEYLRRQLHKGAAKINRFTTDEPGTKSFALPEDAADRDAVLERLGTGFSRSGDTLSTVILGAPKIAELRSALTPKNEGLKK